MSWSYRIARIAGTDVRLHVTFLLFLAWIGYSDYRYGGAAAASAGMLFVLLIFGCVLLHEFGHALAARRYGIPTPDITILPIGGVARLARMPHEPGQEFVIAIAGPAVNVAIAVILYVVLGSGAAQDVLALHAPSRIFERVLTINIWLVLFNLIPAFPMDGGRMLRALLAMRLPYARATNIAATVGKALAVVLGFIGLFGNPMLVLIALFVFQGASMEAAAAQHRENQQMPASAAMQAELRVLRFDANLAEALGSMLHTDQHAYPVAGFDGGVIGIVMQAELVEGMQRLGPGARIEQFVRTGVPVVTPATPLNEVVMLMQQRGCPAVFVSDNGTMAGIVTLESIEQALSARGRRR